MRKLSPLVVVLALGLAVGYLVGARNVPPREHPARATQIVINRPNPDGTGRMCEHLRVYRTHGDPVEPRPSAPPMFIITARSPNWEQTWFAEPATEE